MIEKDAICIVAGDQFQFGSDTVSDILYQSADRFSENGTLLLGETLAFGPYSDP
jgi:hypothetical protein